MQIWFDENQKVGGAERKSTNSSKQKELKKKIEAEEIRPKWGIGQVIVQPRKLNKKILVDRLKSTTVLSKVVVEIKRKIL